MCIRDSLRAASAGRSTPLSGNFFYSQLNYNENVQGGMHSLDLTIDGEVYSMALTTQEESIAVYSTECTQCQVPKKFDLNKV